ncbi:MAG: hypothetical protein MJK10_03975 [Pseudomonadales bacterium]|nr:hypothetical protein [Pseudomonadales bacterium]NRA15231.1 hypothetical protein [Oceanospirillaceae bacterium]
MLSKIPDQVIVFSDKETGKVYGQIKVAAAAEGQVTIENNFPGSTIVDTYVVHQLKQVEHAA